MQKHMELPLLINLNNKERTDINYFVWKQIERFDLSGKKAFFASGSRISVIVVVAIAAVLDGGR